METSSEEVRRRITVVVAQLTKLEIEQISGEARFLEDLALDSLKRFELFARVADDFDLKFDPDQAAHVQNVNDACAFVASQLNAEH